jgi:IS605 OrfB family transposase
MKQTLLVKLAPDASQHDGLLRTLEAFNDACNWIAAVAYEQGCANKIELQKLVYYDARERFGLAAQMAIRAISKVVEAYKRDTTVKPTFRRHGAMTYDERVLSFKGLDHVSILTLDGRLLVPVRIKDYFEARRDRIKGQSDLLYRDGTFYLAVTLDAPEPAPDDADDFLGIDLGIVNLATDSDGETYSGGAVELKRRVYAHCRRNLQRKGTLSARRKLKRLRGRQARYQRDTNHIISKQVVQKAKGTRRGIALENLGGIRERVSVKSKQRARHANWSFFQLRSFIAYKAKLAGVRVVLVDPRNSSRECDLCGTIAKANRPNQATFSCTNPLCKHAALADHNAARVLRKRARAAVRQPNGGHKMAPKVSDAPTGVAPETSPPASAVGG